MTDPSQSLTLAEWFALFGVKLATLIAGFAGATVGLVKTPKLGPLQLVAAVLGGTVFAYYGEPIITYFAKTPGDLQAPAAFLLGLVGLILVAGIVEVAKALPAIAIRTIETIAERISGGGK